MASACPHLIWDVETDTDHDGMATEHCLACGATRKTAGTWSALKDRGNVVRNAMYAGSSYFNASEPPFGSFINNVDMLLMRSEPETVMKDREVEYMPKKRLPRPHGFWKKHTKEIIADIEELGYSKAKKKWNVPESTWQLYLPVWIPVVTTTPPVKDMPAPVREAVIEMAEKAAIQMGAQPPFQASTANSGRAIREAGLRDKPVVDGAMFCPCCGKKTLIPVYEYIIRFHGAIMAVAEDGHTLIPAVPKEYICEVCKKAFEIKQTLVIC